MHNDFFYVSSPLKDPSYRLSPKMSSSLSNDYLSFYYANDNKFPEDCVVLQKEELLLCFKGVVWNKAELLRNNASKSWSEWLFESFRQDISATLKKLRGSFCGLFSSLDGKMAEFFTCHQGDRPVYYSQYETSIIASTNYYLVVQQLKRLGASLEIHTDALNMLMVTGLLPNEHTLVSHIKRSLPGTSIRFSKLRPNLTPYHTLNYGKTYSGNIDDAVEELDLLFRKATQRIFERDRTSGYERHLVNLSGGNDSRMVSWVAHEMGYTNQINYTFGHSQSHDIAYAERLAKQMNHEQLTHFLDRGTCLLLLDEVIDYVPATVSYLGSAHGMEAWENKVDSTLYGQSITGQLGDALVGAFSGIDHHAPAKLEGLTGFSSERAVQIDSLELDRYESNEIASFYLRGFLGALQSSPVTQRYTEVASPFLDVELMEWCFSLPLHFRMNHKLYYKWMQKKHPDSTRVRTTTLNGKIGAPRLFSKATSLFMLIQNKLSLLLSGEPTLGIGSPTHMNPYALWARNNKDIHEFYEDTFYKTIALVPDNKTRAQLEIVFKTGQIMDQALVLTILSFWRKVNNV